MDWPPDYVGELVRRATLEERLCSDPELLAAAKEFYASDPVAFVADLIWIVEPRNANVGLPTKLRFVTRTSAPVEKSRDSGASWMACAFAVWLWLFIGGSTAGFGSRKEDYVDRLGDMDTLFEKMRSMIRNLPPCMLPEGFSEKVHFNHMRLINPANGATIKGEAGDNIGRGGRTSVYFVDEAAFIERPKAVNAALSANTDCRIDISSCRAGTDFQARCDATSPPLKFVFDIRDAPWHTDAWIEKKQREVDEGTFAQEFLRDPTAAIEGQLIPSKWVESAVDADKILIGEPTGAKLASLDVADGGNDRNAVAARHGIVVTECVTRGELMADGGGAWAYGIAKGLGCEKLTYDSIGVGAGAAAVLRDKTDIKAVGWSAAGAVDKPEGLYPPNAVHGTPGARKNKDMFANAKAQAWWFLKDRFHKTFKVITAMKAGEQWPPGIEIDDLISLSSRCTELRELKSELSQVTWTTTNAGKIIINKAPNGQKSPNRADAVMIVFAPEKTVRAPSFETVGGI